MNHDRFIDFLILFQIFNVCLYFLFWNIKTLTFIPYWNSNKIYKILSTLGLPPTVCGVLHPQFRLSLDHLKGIPFPFPSYLAALPITAFASALSPGYLWAEALLSSLSQQFYSSSHLPVSLSWPTPLPFLHWYYSLLDLLLILLFRFYFLQLIFE